MIYGAVGSWLAFGKEWTDWHNLYARWVFSRDPVPRRASTRHRKLCLNNRQLMCNARALLSHSPSLSSFYPRRLKSSTVWQKEILKAIVITNALNTMAYGGPIPSRSEYSSFCGRAGGDASLASAYLRVVSCYCLSRILILWSVPPTPKRMGTSIKSYIPKQQITTCNLWPKQVNLLNPPWIALIWIAADASSARQIGFYVLVPSIYHCTYVFMFISV